MYLLAFCEYDVMNQNFNQMYKFVFFLSIKFVARFVFDKLSYLGKLMYYKILQQFISCYSYNYSLVIYRVPKKCIDV